MNYKGIRVEKGMTIPAEEVLDAIGKQGVEGPAKAFALLKFAENLESHLRDCGYSANVKASDCGVSWLTDTEALAFNLKRRRSGKRKIRRSQAGLQSVDPKALSRDDREKLESTQRSLVHEVAAISGRLPQEFYKPVKAGR